MLWADHSSAEFLTNMVCLSVFVKLDNDETPSHKSRRAMEKLHSILHFIKGIPKTKLQ